LVGLRLNPRTHRDRQRRLRRCAPGVRRRPASVAPLLRLRMAGDVLHGSGRPSDAPRHVCADRGDDIRGGHPRSQSCRPQGSWAALSPRSLRRPS